MTRNVLILILIVALQAVAGPAAQAAVVPGLYDTEVPVASQSPEDRSAAFQEALARVLVKVTGSKTIVETAKVEEVLRKAARYVRSFRYVEQPPAAGSRGQKEPLLNLSVSFDGEALQRLLIETGLPVWSANRPAVLMLVAAQDARGKIVLAESGEHAAKELIREIAAERGIPVLFPLLDAKERGQFSFAQIHAGSAEAMLKPAQRYHAPIIVLGFLETDGQGVWSARWSVHRENVASRWTEADVPLEQVIRSGVDGMADILSSRYAISSKTGEAILDAAVQVDGITTFADYARVMNFLDGLIFVEDVMPAHVEVNRVVFHIKTRSDLRELERILAASDVLRPAASPLTTEFDPSVPLRKRVDLSFSYYKR
jgi:hypothetical protein